MFCISTNVLTSCLGCLVSQGSYMYSEGQVLSIIGGNLFDSHCIVIIRDHWWCLPSIELDVVESGKKIIIL